MRLFYFKTKIILPLAMPREYLPEASGAVGRRTQDIDSTIHADRYAPPIS